MRVQIGATPVENGMENSLKNKAGNTFWSSIMTPIWNEPKNTNLKRYMHQISIVCLKVWYMIICSQFHRNGCLVIWLHTRPRKACQILHCLHLWRPSFFASCAFQFLIMHLLTFKNITVILKPWKKRYTSLFSLLHYSQG